MGCNGAIVSPLRKDIARRDDAHLSQHTKAKRTSAIVPSWMKTSLLVKVAAFSHQALEDLYPTYKYILANHGGVIKTLTSDIGFGTDERVQSYSLT